MKKVKQEKNHVKKIKVSIIDNKENKLPTGMRLLLRRACLAVLKYENFELPAEVSITFVSKNEIKELNSSFRNKNAVTDVLSFPLGENGVYDLNPENGNKLLGDIVICTDVAHEQSITYNHSFEREICFLTVHSMLHLLGYDHMNETDEAIMNKKQKDIMKLLGVNR